MCVTPDIYKHAYIVPMILRFNLSVRTLLMFVNVCANAYIYTYVKRQEEVEEAILGGKGGSGGVESNLLGNGSCFGSVPCWYACVCLCVN